jgi:hypothetical protein
MNISKIYTPEFLQSVKDLYALDMSMTQCALALNTTPKIIYTALVKSNTPRTRSGAKTGHLSSFDRAKQDLRLLDGSKESAYWLGFLLADGSINKVGDIKLSLSIKDREHLEKFRLYLGLSKIREYIGTSNTKMLQVRTGDVRYINALAYWGIVPAKSYSVGFNISIDPLLLGYYLVGWFDGDGHFNWKQPRFSITGNQYQIKWYGDKLKQLSYLGTVTYTLPKDRVWGKLYVTGGNQVSSLIEILMPFAKEFGISRKWDEAYKFLDSYMPQFSAKCVVCFKGHNAVNGRKHCGECNKKVLGASCRLNTVCVMCSKTHWSIDGRYHCSACHKKYAGKSSSIKMFKGLKL